MAFHATADRIGVGAVAKDKAGVVTTLAETLAACTACHDGFRQEILAEADYAAATGSAAPNHSAGHPSN